MHDKKEEWKCISSCRIRSKSRHARSAIILWARIFTFCEVCHDVNMISLNTRTTHSIVGNNINRAKNDISCCLLLAVESSSYRLRGVRCGATILCSLVMLLVAWTYLLYQSGLESGITRESPSPGILAALRTGISGYLALLRVCCMACVVIHRTGMVLRMKPLPSRGQSQSSKPSNVPAPVCSFGPQTDS